MAVAIGNSHTHGGMGDLGAQGNGNRRIKEVLNLAFFFLGGVGGKLEGLQ